ncbi:hypothetical protein SLUN_21820 [Streptomyces lunaelactis]|uniref:Secreted protein n=1 Tax=Streptomyces lunaelactis TaxID=1535768 RepID=A0A2R4T5L5_9ACTN|nr:hypothetical protein [Streptomyces lunaelactis]AVZ74408.1 hypothetical protein SLUN_21820 [Streptomyces lunaelactis]NUK89537.1 hypothetical protein [Streptomyces lunaelactis]
MNKIRRAVTVAAAATSAVVLASTPASAYPTWQPWVPNAFSYCGPTTHSDPSTKVIHQACIIENLTHAQGVLLVRNNATVNILIDEGTVTWRRKDGSFITRVNCNEKVVRPGELTACYGETIYASPGDKAIGSYGYNNSYNITEPVINK